MKRVTLAPTLEAILRSDIVSADGKRKFRAGEIVYLTIHPTADVGVFRVGQEAQGVTAQYSELRGAEVIER